MKILVKNKQTTKDTLKKQKHRKDTCEKIEKINKQFHDLGWGWNAYLNDSLVTLVWNKSALY